LRCRIDTGADDTIFPAWLAQQLGIDLSSAPTADSRTASGAVVQYHCAPVTLRISDGLESCSLSAVVGFVNSPRNTGLIGLAGFLEYFDSTMCGQARETLLASNALVPGLHVVH
jgi:predicted aspartyl protease